MKILSLFIRYGTEKYESAFDALSEFYQRAMPNANITRVIVDSSLPEGEEHKLHDGTVLIAGDNTCWEFSAWDTAIRRYEAEFSRYDFVHFVTSAYHQLYTAYIDRISDQMLDKLKGKDMALGHLDSYNEPVGYLGCTSQVWIRSSFIFVPPSTLRRLGRMTTLADKRAWFSGDPNEPFAATAPISATMKENIISWLTGSGTGQGTEWHSRFSLTSETIPFFEAKALAILNEHALSLRLLAQGTSLVDPTWAMAAINSKDFGGMNDISNWREQLIQRRPFL